MIEVIFVVLLVGLVLALIYNLVMAVYYFVRGVLELVWSVLTWPFRLFRPRRPAPPPPPPRPVRWEDVFGPPTPAEPESRYTRDWATVSRKYKESRGWRCEDCGVYCGSRGDRRLLHVHHRDLDPQNNARSNLDALCVVCHSERPGTGHRRLAGAITSDGRRWSVERLRRQQGR